MKKLPLYIFLILLLGLPTSASMVHVPFAEVKAGVVISSVAGGATLDCTTADDSNIADTTFSTNGGGSSNDFIAGKVSLSSLSRVTALVAGTCDNGGDTGSSVAYLYTHDAVNDEPDSAVSGVTGTVSYSSIDACNTYANIEYALSSPVDDVSAGTYWVVIEASDGGAHKVEYESTTGRRCTSSDGTTWSCSDNRSMNVEVWGCQ